MQSICFDIEGPGRAFFWRTSAATRCAGGEAALPAKRAPCAPEAATAYKRQPSS